MIDGQSLHGFLMDMPDDGFRLMLAKANMTVLLNIQQTLLVAYRHTARVKDMLIDAVLNGPGDARAASDTVAKLHAILLRAEIRYFQVKEAIKQRDSDTENLYRNLSN